MIYFNALFTDTVIVPAGFEKPQRSLISNSYSLVSVKTVNKTAVPVGIISGNPAAPPLMVKVATKPRW